MRALLAMATIIHTTLAMQALMTGITLETTPVITLETTPVTTLETTLVTTLETTGTLVVVTVVTHTTTTIPITLVLTPRVQATNNARTCAKSYSAKGPRHNTWATPLTATAST